MVSGDGVVVVVELVCDEVSVSSSSYESESEEEEEAEVVLDCGFVVVGVDSMVVR